MKSMSDLMLKTHFNELKEELNNAINSAKNAHDPNEIKLLKRTFNYLKLKAEACQLDDSGYILYNDIAKLLDEYQHKQSPKPTKKTI